MRKNAPIKTSIENLIKKILPEKICINLKEAIQWKKAENVIN